MVPILAPQMEDCPADSDDNILLVYLVLSAFVNIAIFALYQGVVSLQYKLRYKGLVKTLAAKKDDEYEALQRELFGVHKQSEDAISDTEITMW